MRAFDSIAKKLAIPMVVLFEIGWIVYTGGLGSYLHQYSQSEPNADEALRYPVLFPYYFTLVGGQFVALLFLVHAALPSSMIVSYIAGVLSSILNVVYFVSVGYMVHWSAPMVRFSEQTIRRDTGNDMDLLKSRLVYLHTVRCILAGGVIMTTSWGLIQLLFFFYNPPNGSQSRSLWQVIREFVADLPTVHLSTLQQKATPGELLRFCTIPLLVLSAVGWCVCIAGLYELNKDTTSPCYMYSSTFSYRYDFGTWATFFIAPILYLASLLHAWCSNDASTMSGVFAAIFNTFFVLNVGFEVVDISTVLYLQVIAQVIPSTSDSQHFNGLILGGGVVCLFFWTIVYAAWNFYCFNGSRDHARLQPNTNRDNDQPQTFSHAQQNEYGDTSFVPMAKKMPPLAEVEMQPAN